MSRIVTVLLALTLTAALAACSDPDHRVMGTSADGDFTLTLSADPNWARPNATLPVVVEITPKGIPDPLTFYGPVTLEANGGTVSPSSLQVSFEVDSTLTVAPVFQAVVSFRAGSVLGDGNGQGEIHAAFEGARATLKLEIIPRL